MDSRDENFIKDRLLNMLIIRNSRTPVGPFVFFYTPEIIIAETTFREFNLNKRSKDTIELIEYLIIILSSSDTASISPHCGKNEESLIDDLLLFFFLF